MKPEKLNPILALSDAGVPVATIAAAVQLTPGRVYAVLREHRPERPRAPRARTSDRRPQIMGLRLAGVENARIAALLGVSRQYVYKVLAEVRV